MNNIFDFEQDRNNYEERMVGRDDYSWGFISTCSVSNGVQPFETAVEHGNYNNAEIVVVEAYDTKEQALAGHARWVATMTTPPLPAKLKDCCNSNIMQLGIKLGYHLNGDE